MARCEFANWNPTGTTPGGTITPRVVIFHVIAGEGNAPPHSGLEWHFEVSYTGALEQQVDTSRRADANYKANGFAISVETEGKGEGLWTDAQLDMLVRLSEWCLTTHPTIKRQRCDKWDGSGFGYHVMWGAPGPWTPVAKSCPGPKRVVQFNQLLLPRILATPPEPPEVEVPDPAIVYTPTGEWVFVRGTNGELYGKRSVISAGRNIDWFSLGGALTSGPDANLRSPNNIGIVARGTDKESYLLNIDDDGNVVTPWRSIGGQS